MNDSSGTTVGHGAAASANGKVDWYFYDLTALPLVVLQLAAVILVYRALSSAFAVVRDFLKDLDGVCEAMERIPSLTTGTLWYPKNVAVVASVYRISPPEVDNEYRKEEDAKRWIVNNTFEENKLTKKLLAAPPNTRFMSVGYDFRPQGNPSTMVAANGARTVVLTSSVIRVKKSTDKAQPTSKA